MMSDLCSLYISNISIEHRQQFGQFFTEERVARFMVQWVCASGISDIYDPGFGLGAFYIAAKAINPNITFRGSEVDPTILAFWRAHVQDPALTLSHEDYLQKWGQRHAAIVCNPPYMRFQKFFSRAEVFKAFKEKLGITLSGYTNIASAFLVKSISELTDGGHLAYILPLEFLNTGYGKFVKEYMLRHGSIYAIIKLECEKDVFPEIITSIGIILYEKKSTTDNIIHFYTVRRIEELDRLLQGSPDNSISQRDLKAHDKWLKYFQPLRLKLKLEYLVPLSTYGAFSRGIATGANEFFVLRPSQLAQLGLSMPDVVECITKSSQVEHLVFTDQHWNNLLSRNASVYLLNLGTSLSPKAVEYVRYGEERGYNKRYLTRTRKPWYRIESRQPAPIWLGVFSRNGYKVIRNYTSALNLTCFHGFQSNLIGLRWVDYLFLYLASSAGRKIVELNIRQYGDSLDKFEPNDLNQALVPSTDWFSRITQKQVEDELEYIALHDSLSSQMEDIFFELIEA